MNNQSTDHQPFSAEPPEQRGPSALLILVGIAAFVMLFSVICGVLVLVIRNAAPAGQEIEVARLEENATPEELAQQLEAKYAEISKAFARTSLGLESEQRADILQLFERLDSSIDQQDDATFANLVDKQRHAEQIIGGKYWISGGYSAIDLGEALNYAVPVTGDSFELLHVELSDDEQTGIAYGLVWTDDISMKTRWWIKPTQRSRRWRIYDWEVLDFGMTESRESWLLLNADDDYATAYNMAMQDIQEADALLVENDWEAARKVLERAGSRRPPASLRESHALSVGFAWSRHGDLEEAFSWFEKAAERGRVPGAEWGKATYYQSTGDVELGLASIERYEQMLGPASDTAAIHADLLVRLDRHEEAMEVYFKALQRQPTNGESLNYLVEHAQGKQRDRLLQHFAELGKQAQDAKRADDVLATLQSLIYRGATPYIEQALVSLGEAAPPRFQGRVINLEASLLDQNYQHAEAAERYLLAYRSTDDGETKTDYLQSYLYSMFEQRRVSEAYAVVDDKQAVFRFYLFVIPNEWEEELPPWMLDTLVELHTVAKPDDPWLKAAQGRQLMKQEQWEQAADALLTSWRAVGEDQYLLYYEFTEAMTRGGKPVEAFLAFDDSEHRFRSIAALLFLHDQLEFLPALIEAHNSQSEPDPWTTYYEAKLLAHQGDTAAAAQKLAFADLEKVEEEYDRIRFYRLTHDILWQRHPDTGLVAASPHKEQAFAYVAEKLEAAGRRDELERLMASPHAKWANAIQLLISRLAIAKQRKDDKAIISLLEPWPPKSLADQTWRLHELRIEKFNALLRLSEFEQAKQVAEGTSEDERKVAWLAAIAVLQDDLGAVEKLLAEESLADAVGAVSWLADHQEVGETFRDEEFADVRRRFPPTATYLPNSFSWPLLRNSVEPLSEDVVSDATRRAWGDEAIITPLARIESVPEGERPRLGGYAVEHAGHRFLIARYPVSHESIDATNFERSEDRQIADQVQATDYILEVTPSPSEAASDALRKLVSALAEDELVVASHQQRTFVVLNDPARAALPHAEAWQAFSAERGTWFWIYPQNTNVESSEQSAIDRAEADRVRMQSVKQRLDRYNSEGEPLVVAFQLNFHGIINETLWLEVERIESGNLLIGRLQNSSAWHTYLQAGTSISIYDYDVTDVK